MKSIVTATDFSAGAELAACRAAQLASAANLPLRLLHVLPSWSLASLASWAVDAVGDALRADASLRLQQLASTLQAASGAEVEAECLTGHVVEELLHARGPEDLLVLGARGAGDWRRLTIGTTAARLLCRIPGAALVVRQPTTGPYQRVVLALDLSPASAPLIAWARQVAPKAHLLLVHVFSVPHEGKLYLAGVDAATVAHYREQARLRGLVGLQQLAESGHLAGTSHSFHLAEGDAGLALLKFAADQNADLIAVGKQGETYAENFLLGSVTQHLLAEAEQDILVSMQRA
jgi:nucleotide-binding universal stress UspA family protein